jgi:hypothetical protein
MVGNLQQCRETKMWEESRVVILVCSDVLPFNINFDAFLPDVVHT